jgi:hypothetical protein
MTAEPPPVRDADGYDVYISHSQADVAWAARLASDLSGFGLRCFSSADVPAGAHQAEELYRALDASAALVVLWSRASEGSASRSRDLAEFESFVRAYGRTRVVMSVVLGDADDAQRAPDALLRRQMLILGRETYEAGPEAPSQEWTRAVEQIVRVFQAASRSTPADLPPFSGAARRALMYAAHALANGPAEPRRARTAALLGALRASAEGGMTPTTGDVVRLILERQADGRSIEATFAAAGAAAGLNPIDEPEGVMSVEKLLSSSVGDLAREGVELSKKTGASRVHLRHILALGVHPAVPDAVLAELGISIPELRKEWRASIARTWPQESQEGWDEILRGATGAPSFAAAPPSARVHADRWTIDDRLDYALYAKAIAEFIRHPDAEPPMVISVQAPWGQGKTSLMRMVQSDLDPAHPDFRGSGPSTSGRETVEPPSELTFGNLRESLDGSVDVHAPKPATIRTVWFNAWKYQDSEQIWAGLAHAILAQLPARLSPKDRELFWLRLQLRRIDPSAVRSDIHRAALERFLPRLAGWLVLGLGAVIVAGFALLAGGLGAVGTAVAGSGALGTALVARRAWAAATREVLERPLEGAYLRYVRQPDYASKLGYLHLVEEDMGRALGLLAPDDQPVVIFIDDLDRCSPANVGEVIEAVNLFLAGEYPNCAFVIGIDAEVIAASMEVVHAEIIDKLGDRRGELGWRFMDKFVQLPFVLPRLHPDQREAYLRGLFSIAREEEAAAVVAEAARLESDVQDPAVPVDELARRVGDLAPRLAVVDPDRARVLGEEVVAAGARAFSDSDPEVIQALADQIRYLSDNPRTIKRAVNLYRFHRFAAFARQASTLPLEVATPAQIGRWVVVIIRWPNFVRWLQAQGDQGGSAGQDPAARVLALAGEIDTPEAFTEALAGAGIEASWIDDEELWQFLRAETPPDLKLDLAAPRGLW